MPWRVLPTSVLCIVVVVAESSRSMAMAVDIGLWALFLLFSSLPISTAFYLPGVAPQDFAPGTELQVKVNKLNSIKTQLPYEYYSLDYCKPAKILNSAENLGEVLRGDRIENSPYVFRMKEDKLCNFVCKIDKLSEKSAKHFKEKIDDEYRVNMILDNLPVAIARGKLENQIRTYERGFPVGLKQRASEQGGDEKYYINNHLSFTVYYHKDVPSTTSRIVGFEVEPYSVKHTYESWDNEKPRLSTCNPDSKQYVDSSRPPQEVNAGEEIIFTYDVKFLESTIKWASRWDMYLLMSDDQIHWFSIINSLMIVLFLSGMVAMIMMRTLHRDISKYNQLDTQDEAQEETGWKLVHGDVFRPPTNAGLLCVYVGTGVQFFGMTVVTMIFALLGFLSPSNRGGLMTAMLLLWVFMGLFAGYGSSRLYKAFKGPDWKINTLKTAFMFPGSRFIIFFILNCLIWGEKSSGAVPFGTMLAPDQQHFNPKIGENQSIGMPMGFEKTRKFLNSAEIAFFTPYARSVEDNSGSLCQEMHRKDATFCDQKFDGKIFKVFDFSPIDSTGAELQRQEAKAKMQSPESKRKNADMVSILLHVLSIGCFIACAMVAVKLIRKHDEPMMARQMELRFLGSRLGMLFAILLTENSSMKFTLEELAELLGTLLPELLSPVLKHEGSFVEEFISSFRSVMITVMSFRKQKEHGDDYNQGHNNDHINEGNLFEEGDMSAEKQQIQKLPEEIGLHFQEPLALQKQVGLLVLAEDYRKGISSLSSEGQLANLSSGSPLIRFQDQYLKIMEKSVKEQERLNKIKSIGIYQKQMLLSVQKEHIRLASESNSLMEKNMILSRTKHLLKLQETEDSELMKAYAGLRKSIAGGVTIGILVMILVVIYASWTYSAGRILEHVSVCQPAGKDTSLLYLLESLTVPFTALICKGIVIGRMIFGLLLLAPVTMLLTWYSKSNQEAHAAKVFLVLVFVCAFLGHMSIKSVGGNGRCWFCLFEIFSLAHVFASWRAPSVYRILNDPFSKAFGSYWMSPRVRYAVFWIFLDLLLPAMAGLLPFQPLSRAIPKLFYDTWDLYTHWK